jgi:hypothetical protein
MDKSKGGDAVRTKDFDEGFSYGGEWSGTGGYNVVAPLERCVGYKATTSFQTATELVCVGELPPGIHWTRTSGRTHCVKIIR